MPKPRKPKFPGKRLLIPVLLTLLLVFVFREDVLFFAGKIYRSIRNEDTEIQANKSGKYRGIDISHHQRHVDWQKLVAENKPDFIYLKSTEGASHVDSKFHEYYRKSRREGIPTGAYHFFSYRTDGLSQANKT